VVDKANRKRDAKHEHTHPEVVLKKRRHSDNHFESNNADSQKFEDGAKSSQDSLPSSLEAEDYLTEGNTETIPAKKIETINLLRGYRHLKNELKQIPKEERSSYLGILNGQPRAVLFSKQFQCLYVLALYLVSDPHCKLCPETFFYHQRQYLRQFVFDYNVYAPDILYQADYYL
jgi:hypothetical protein